MAQELRKIAEALQRSVRSINSKHINLESTKEQVRGFVNAYFRDYRQQFVFSGDDVNVMLALDALVQALLRCTHQRTLKRKYIGLIKEIMQLLGDVEILLLKSPSAKAIGDGTGADQRILRTLQGILSSAAASFEQGLADLADNNRISWRGTIVEFREALREVLDHMAPDSEVRAQSGFKIEPDTKGPTMKQKVIFILRKRQKPDSTVKSAAETINLLDERVGLFVRSVYQRSAAGTHVQTSSDEANRVKDYVIVALKELLEVR